MTDRRWWTASTTITKEGRRTRSNLQTMIVALILVAIVGWALAEFGRDRAGTGPNGSVFVTDINGTAALGELLEQLGHPVLPAIAPLTGLDSGGTLMILDPGFRSTYAATEIESIVAWLEGGGRLIVSGRPHPDLIGDVLPDDIRLGFSGASPAPIVTPIRGITGDVVTGGVYSIETDSDLLPLAGNPPIAAAYEVGSGVVVYIADSSMLWNPSLEQNGPWIVSLVPDGPVRFDEVRHGFTANPASETPTGLLAALPESVRRVILLLIPVLVLALITYGRRFGPPEETERRIAPPRRELVDAVAGLMARMGDPVEAAELVPVRLREVVARRIGLPADARPDTLVDRAQELGLDPNDLERALDPTDEDTMLEAQRLLAHLTERERL